jgi:hypothetical protein
VNQKEELRNTLRCEKERRKSEFPSVPEVAPLACMHAQKSQQENFNFLSFLFNFHLNNFFFFDFEEKLLAHKIISSLVCGAREAL